MRKENRCQCDKLIEVLGDISGLAMLHTVFGPTPSRNNGGNARSERLENSETKSIRLRWENEGVHVGECAGQLSAGEDASEFSPLHVASEPPLLCALTNHYN